MIILCLVARFVAGLFLAKIIPQLLDAQLSDTGGVERAKSGIWFFPYPPALRQIPPVAVHGTHTNPSMQIGTNFFSPLFGCPERMSHSEILSRIHSFAHSLNTNLSKMIGGSSNVFELPSITWTILLIHQGFLVWGEESVPICIGTHCIPTQGQVSAYKPIFLR